MRAHEYIHQVTSGIADPARAAEIRRELQSHLDQAVADLTGQPIDEETAELLAVTRMGPAEGLARQFAELDSPGLPWRHYLSVIPIVCLIAMFFIWDAPSDFWRIGIRWVAVLAVCMMPSRHAFARLFQTIKADATAKWYWLKRQELPQAIRIGGVAGAAAGMTWAGIPPLWEMAWQRLGGPVFGDPHPNPILHVGIPLVLAGLFAWVLRRRYLGTWSMLATISGAAFPIGFLPVYLVWGRPASDWITMLVTLQIVYALSAILAGALADARARARLTPAR